ncbi:MAG: FIG00667993: hypothetical protein, partial [uncultured Rubrobacteraceae bacterium]
AAPPGLPGLGGNAPHRRRDPGDVRDGPRGWAGALALRRAARLMGDRRRQRLQRGQGARRPAPGPGPARLRPRRRAQGGEPRASRRARRGRRPAVGLARPQGEGRVAGGPRRQGLRPALCGQRGGGQGDGGPRGRNVQHADRPLAGAVGRHPGRDGPSARRVRRGARRLWRLCPALRDTRPRPRRLPRLRQIRPQERPEHLPERDAPGGDGGCSGQGEGQAGGDRALDARPLLPGGRDYRGGLRFPRYPCGEPRKGGGM